MIGNTNAKIKKGGGSEAQLYDTKILSTQSAGTGWVYNCGNSVRTFSSSTLPTLYNDISTKLSNCNINSINVENTGILANEGQVSASSSALFSTLQNGLGVKFYDTSEYGSGDWEDFTINVNGNDTIPTWGIVCPDTNIMIAADWDHLYKIEANASSIRNYNILSYIYDINIGPMGIYDDAGEILIKKIGSNIYFTNRITSSFEYNDTIYVTNDIVGQGGDEFSQYHFTFDETSVDIAPCISDFLYVNGYWYLLQFRSSTYGGFAIFKGTSLSNSELADTSKWTVVYQTPDDYFFADSQSSIQYVVAPQMYYANNKFYVYAYAQYADNGIGTPKAHVVCRYTEDNFLTFSNRCVATVQTGAFDNHSIIRCDGKFLVAQIQKVEPDYEEREDYASALYYCPLSGMDNSNNWKVQYFNFEYMTQISYPYNSYFYIHNYYVDGKSAMIYKAQLIDGVQTDSYVVNDSVIDINYYAYNNFKICMYDNLNLLNSLYAQYNVSNYWNIYNNQITIPMNKQNYSVIYVGDNYVDSI